MEFNIGDEIEFVKDVDDGYYTETDQIPEDKIKHGNFGGNLPKTGIIVDIHEEYFIVEFRGRYNTTLKLGYKSEDIRLISPKQLEEKDFLIF